MNKKGLVQVFGCVLVIFALIFGVSIVKNKDKEDNVVENQPNSNQSTVTSSDNEYDFIEDVDLNDELEDIVNNNNVETELSNEEQSVNSEENEEGENKKDDEKPSSVPQQSKKQSGIFQGFADGNFIEVKVNDEYNTYRVSSSAKQSLANKDFGDSITFEYTEEDGQLIINSVK